MKKKRKRTVLLELHVDRPAGSPDMEEVTDVLDHLVEGLREEGISCYYVESDEPRPKDFADLQDS